MLNSLCTANRVAILKQLGESDSKKLLHKVPLKSSKGSVAKISIHMLPRIWRYETFFCYFAPLIGYMIYRCVIPETLVVPIRSRVQLSDP